MKIRRYLSRFSFAALLLLLIGAGVGLVVFQARGGRIFSIQSGSMEPAMSKGGLVGVNPISEGELRVGDVITFMSPENRDVTITHRVVELETSSETGRQIITTKGDANDYPDPPISKSLVIGRSEMYLPYAGAALDFVRKPVGLLILIYVPALTVVIAEIRRLKEYYKSMEPYVLPELMSRQKPSHTGRNLALTILFGGVLLVPTITVRAALQSTAALTGNTISSIAAEPAPPSPEPPAHSPGGLTLRRVFIACDNGEDTAATVQIILYNSSRQTVDISGWTIKSGAHTLLTLPSGTTIAGPGLYETEAPIMEGISYSRWRLGLFSSSNEQIHDTSWEINTDRSCRITQV